MPGFVVHAVAAHRVLAEWSAPPFDPRSPANRSAFLAGGMGPDLGYFRSVDALLSDLAHYVNSAELGRQLLVGAKSETERAFAWGWCLHILVDATLHPAVNAAAGSSRGNPTQPLTYADDPRLHTRIEFGLDTHLGTTTLVGCDFPAVFDARSVWFICEAYQRTYQFRPAENSVSTSLAACAAFSRRFALLRRWTAIHFGLVPLWAWMALPELALYHSLRGAVRMFARSSPAHSLLTAIPPDQRLLEAMEPGVVAVVDRFRSEATCEFTRFPNLNLDTGLDESVPYSLRDETLRQLRHLVEGKDLHAHL